MHLIEKIKFDENGLIPAVTQDYETQKVLMLAYMNEMSIEKTLETGFVHYWSRSRNKLWLKGEQSGHKQIVKEIYIDCDNDTLLIKVDQIKAACHTGHYSCFYTEIKDGKRHEKEKLVFDSQKVYKDKTKVLKDVYDIISDRQKNPKEGSYTNYLFEKGIDKILKKVGEESAEVIIAAKNKSKSEIKYEVADLIYHLMVLMVERGLKWDDIFDELIGRK